MGERRSRRERERERERRSNGVAEGLLLGAVAAGALFLGYKKNQEDRKLADTLLEVASKEDRNYHGIDLTLREVPSSFFSSSANSKTADLRESALNLTADALKSDPLWVYLFHDQGQGSEREIRAKIRSFFSCIYENSNNFDNDRYMLKAMYTRHNRNNIGNGPLQVSLVITLINHANVDPVFSSKNISGVSSDVRERLVAFGRFLAVRKERLLSGGGNFVEISRMIINQQLEISDDILEACIDSILNNPPFGASVQKPNLLACVYSVKEKSMYESVGFRVVDEITFPIQAPQIESHSNALDESGGVASHQFTCYFLTLQF
uniref:Uncharacterized protein n=1 Tax=Aplanochytrium stocchinoi TaxID=215587 RepID=A0A7S3PFD4_9STRA|mmetsp:Transcript_18200/g.22339  ORF Transcript_18200/g.22339 Transcript_18200/m.22339 type:complete len:321 (+) Transcript_18200:174-1136(+)|eukprot:CAMPEP_0204859062 /NCGR_PEP_ID=MMETSP1347-20130617/23462_1 /ASSEMBLY_ACC=CAM_ASM_000690 /TAXON_ID=215587 /ORGANISM="Aplanochytrium stocchinoi, Strain GSBS06" /LENGTH=320 /DNA_ID=CAMNT_0052007445 /DNA_START=48 /DNA_END=1010 /DNA_ORIENTATION=+